MVASVDIGGRAVGRGQSCFVIAEAGVNHNGDAVLAKRLVDVAVEAGADAVKFQTFHAESLLAPGAPKAIYQLRATDARESQLEMLRRLELPDDGWQELYRYCLAKGILFISTPFDRESANLLAGLGVAALKIPSGEITNLPFLAHVARQGRPLIVSTGMSTLGEVETALCTLREAGSREIVLLHCVSSYPAEPSDANLRAMHTLEAAFGLPVGYSDHTPGIEVSLAAVALGACVIEKHFTVDRSLPGPDHQASLEPQELAALVKGIRHVEAALGHGRKEPAASEANTAAVARRSLVAARDIPAGVALCDEMITAKRPGTGLHPALRESLVGRVTRTAIRAGELLTWEMLR